MKLLRRFALAIAAAAVMILAHAPSAHGQVFESINSFSGCPVEGCGPADDVAHPTRLILGADGNFYGASGIDRRVGESGPRDWGAIFRQRPDGTREILHRFSGSGPGGCGADRVTFGQDGKLYGVGWQCYSSGGGAAIFRLDGNSFELLQEFPIGNQAYPDGVPALQWIVAGSNGAFYGVAKYTDSKQAIFKWDGDVTWLSYPPLTRVSDDFLLASDGNLYFAGQFDHPILQFFGGSVLRITTADRIEKVADWNSNTGPSLSLMFSEDGFLYGLEHGRYGAQSAGLFRMSLTGEVTYRPAGGIRQPLAEGPDRSLYLSTPSSIFRLTPEDELLPVHEFTESGDFPSLTQGPDGHLYGIRVGGAHGLGMFFRIRMPSVDVKANGAEGPVTVNAGDPLQISMAFDASATEVVDPAEIYLAVVTPSLDVFWATAAGFSATPAPLYAGPLPSFGPAPLITLPDAAVLPEGDYYWVTIVDADLNGIPNGTYVDFVKTTKGAAPLAVRRRQ